MTECKGDDLAFPMVFPSGPPFPSVGTGLTKREYFAAKALQGILASAHPAESWSALATCAVGAADALIAELGRKAGE
jgi:hypothetical protein